MLIDRFAKSETARRRSLAGVGIALALIAVAGMARDWRRPYKTPADAQLRDIVMDIARQAKPEDQIVVMDSPEETVPQFVWYLRQLKDPVAWRGRIDWDRLKIEEPRTTVSACAESGCAEPLTVVRGSAPPAVRHLWCLYLTRDLTRRDAIMAILAPARRPLVLAGHEESSLQFGQSYETLEHCEVFHWICLPADAGMK